MTTETARQPEATALTSVGRVRNHNEDSFGYLVDRGVFVVCDGMGGAAGGEVASRLATDTVLEQFAQASDSTSPRDLLHGAVLRANRAVHELAESDPGLYGMGTTLVALLLVPPHALIAHAGDSRCYLFRHGQLTRQTHDHSLVDEQIRLGTLTREEAERSPFRSVITRAIGTQPGVTPEMLEVALEPGDLFLLCTDGLTRELDEDSIAGILSAGANLNLTAHILVDAADEAGGRDNITCLLVRIP